MQNTSQIKRPALTFPKDVGEYVLDAYRDAKVILEYGSGGSTVAASEMVGKTIMAVESDRVWAENISILRVLRKPNLMA